MFALESSCDPENEPDDCPFHWHLLSGITECSAHPLPAESPPFPSSSVLAAKEAAPMVCSNDLSACPVSQCKKPSGLNVVQNRGSRDDAGHTEQTQKLTSRNNKARKTLNRKQTKKITKRRMKQWVQIKMQ